MPEPLVRRWFQMNSSNICNLVLHHWLTKPTRTPIWDFHRTHRTEAPCSLHMTSSDVQMHNKPFSPPSQNLENNQKWDFEGKKWCFWDAVKLKQNQQQTPYIWVWVPWKNFFWFQQIWGKVQPVQTKLSADRLKAVVKGGCCWALPSVVAAWLQSMKICTLNTSNVKISKYLFATTLKLLPKTLKMAVLKAWNPSTDPGTAQVVEFSIAAALFLWKHKFSLNWIWQLKSKEI